MRDGDQLVFDRTSERGSSRTVFEATATGFRWAKSFRPPGGDAWQSVFEETLTSI